MFRYHAPLKSWRCILAVAALLAGTASAAVPTISFDSPHGGEVYAVGQIQKIRLGIKTKAKVVKIELSRDGGATFELLGSIENSVKDLNLRNVLSFTVAAPASSNCVIRASGAIGKVDVVALSSPFSIGSAGAPLNSSVTSAAISSGGASSNFALIADGSGGASFTDIDGRYVKKAGDTMTGALSITDGTAAFSRSLVVNRTGTSGEAATLQVSNPTNNNTTLGIGNDGLGRGIAVSISNAANPNSVIYAEQHASGAVAELRSLNVNSVTEALIANTVGLGGAGQFRIGNTANSSTALLVVTSGTGTGLLVDQGGASGDIAVFQSNTVNQSRIDKTGKGFFNGGTQTGGADVAEAVAVKGERSGFEPGDVLVISSGGLRFEKSAAPYSKSVSGVIATKPGVLLTERDATNDSLKNLVPMGVVGIIPTKVCSENGLIHAGDLLVTSSKPGHAMKGTDQKKMLGATIGKALQDFDGEGAGVIKVLVNVK